MDKRLISHKLLMFPILRKNLRTARHLLIVHATDKTSGVRVGQLACELANASSPACKFIYLQKRIAYQSKIFNRCACLSSFVTKLSETTFMLKVWIPCTWRVSPKPINNVVKNSFRWVRWVWYCTMLTIRSTHLWSFSSIL